MKIVEKEAMVITFSKNLRNVLDRRIVWIELNFLPCFHDDNDDGDRIDTPLLLLLV